jgi:DNA-binding NarL/FixJ family response regulator
VERDGFSIIRLAGTRAAARVPFGALAPLAPMLPSSQDQGIHSRTARIHQFAANLVQQSNGQRLILFVDDAHLLDDSSATLIHQLAMAGQISLIVTVRTGTRAPDPIVALWKDGLLERRELEVLSPNDLNDLLAALLPGVIEPGAKAHFASRAQGNVVFLRELVLGALRDGTLTQDAGVWRLTGPPQLSARLVEFVESRFSEISTEQRALLEVISFGEPLGISELATLTDLNTAEEMERKGLLTSSIDSLRLGIRLAHPLYGEVLRSRVSALRRRVIARRLAAALTATGLREKDDVLRMAVWYLDAGGGDASLLLEGARAARRRFDFPLAERMAHAAIDGGAGIDARLLVAHLVVLQGRAGDAERILRELAGEATDDTQRGAVALERIDNCAFNCGRIQDGLRFLEEAEATIRDEPLRDELLARRALLVLGSEGPGKAGELIGPVLGQAGGKAHTYGSLVAAQIFYRQGRLRQAAEIAGRAYPSDLSLQPELRVHSVFGCQALIELGELQDAEAIASRNYEQSLVDRSSQIQAMFAWQLAKLNLVRGRVVTAAAYGGEAVRLLQQLGREELVRMCSPTLVTALAISGRSDKALETWASLQDAELSRHHYAGVDPLEARAWIAAADGDLPLARQLLQDAVSLGETICDHIGTMSALHGLARLGYAGLAARQMACVAPKIDGELAAARLKHVVSLTTQDAQGLTDASLAFESHGADLFAAEAAADATVAWRRAGERVKATFSARRAADLVSRCEGALTPPLQAVEARILLTPAERETAVLAALGWSNKEIATELTISVRTAETYLQRAYSKLGVSSRKELGVVLRRSVIGSGPLRSEETPRVAGPLPRGEL